MQYKTITCFYINILKHGHGVEYSGGDSYRVITYYSPGVVQATIEYKDGLEHGDFIWFDKLGHQTSVAKYIDGFQSGPTMWEWEKNV